MTADSQGNDITTVGIPVTGYIGLGPFGSPFPTPEAGNSAILTLNPSIRKIGLLTKDGGPQFSWEADGDPIEFWQDGYSIPSGLANVTLVVKAAQTDAFVREIISGRAPDANNVVDIDGGGHSTQYILFTEEAFKNGAIRRRGAPNTQVTSVKEDQNTRGEVLGYELTFKINRSPSIGNKHFREWLINP